MYLTLAAMITFGMILEGCEKLLAMIPLHAITLDLVAGMHENLER